MSKDSIRQVRNKAGYSVARLAEGCKGRVLQHPSSDLAIIHLLTDSRKLVFPETSVFFALGHGSRRNGHAYIAELYRRGLRCFVVSQQVQLQEFPEACFILVPDCLRALQELAASHRSEFHFPVIGITGSNGKTIVKEWLYHCLSPYFRIVRSPKSYNSQIGVPLSVWQMAEADQLGIFEAGISLPGEMRHLQNIIRPDIGIFTNLLDAHDEGFVDKASKAREKFTLFHYCKHVIYCLDHRIVHDAVHDVVSAMPELSRPKLLAWGEAEGSALRISGKVSSTSKTEVHALYDGRMIQVTLPFTDAASVENAMHVWLAMLHIGISDADIQQQMLGLPALAMRMEIKDALNQSVLINDSYSADLSSLRLALDVLVRQGRKAGLTVILSDIPESGRPAEELYLEVALELSRRGVSKLLGIGNAITKYASFFSERIADCRFFPSTDSFLEQFHPSQHRDEAILLKGARVFGFERIAARLEKQAHLTVLEINLSALADNLSQYRRMLRPEVRIMAMVKAFSYGAGAFEIASLLQFHQVDWLSVAYADEGVELRRSGIRLPIMVMNPEPEGYRMLTDYDLQPEIYSFAMAEDFSSYLESEGLQGYPVHVKLDTGMHRLGFTMDELQGLCSFLKKQSRLHVISAFSHLAAAEDPREDAFTRAQAKVFTQACDALQEALGYRFIRHLSNTSAVHRHTGLQYDMVRLGIGLYGIDGYAADGFHLRNALSLTTSVAQVQKVAAGDTIGYGRMARLERDALIATIRIGYADGFPRSLGNGVGRVWIAGKFFPVIGHVCMDMVMIDISGHADIEAGARVVVFGMESSLQEFARLSGTIPYEILTRISPRVKRVYVED